MKGIGFEAMLHRDTDFARAFGGNSYYASGRHSAAQAITAGDIFMSFRHPGVVSPAKPLIIVVQQVRAKFASGAGASAAGVVGLALKKLTGYTVEDTAGAAVTPDKYDSRSPAAVGLPRYKADGFLAAGTRTPADFSVGCFAKNTYAAAPTNLPDFDVPLLDEPVVLYANEGLELQQLFDGPASLTASLGFCIAWAEIPEENFPK